MAAESVSRRRFAKFFHCRVTAFREAARSNRDSSSHTECWGRSGVWERAWIPGTAARLTAWNGRRCLSSLITGAGRSRPDERPAHWPGRPGRPGWKGNRTVYDGPITTENEQQSTSEET